jgi:hypothetical protein
MKTRDHLNAHHDLATKRATDWFQAEAAARGLLDRHVARGRERILFNSQVLFMPHLHRFRDGQLEEMQRLRTTATATDQELKKATTERMRLQISIDQLSAECAAFQRHQRDMEAKFNAAVVERYQAQHDASKMKSELERAQAAAADKDSGFLGDCTIA